MIYLYSGTPGSGKSLHAARVIYHRLKNGKPVVCNFDINGAIKHDRQFHYIPNDVLHPQQLCDIADNYFASHRFKEESFTLVIDECQLLFNAREWDAKGRNDWLSFFSQHRKYGYDIILIAQFDRMVDRQIRSLIEYNVIHRKVSNFGVYGKILSLLAFGKLFVSVKIWYPLKEKVGAEYFIARKKYYGIYDSYSRFVSADKT